MRKAELVEFEWVFRSTYTSVLRTTYLVLHDRGRAEEAATAGSISRSPSR